MSDAWNEGRLAGSQKKKDNPHPVDSVEYDEWEAGRESVEGVDEDGEPKDDA